MDLEAQSLPLTAHRFWNAAATESSSLRSAARACLSHEFLAGGASNVTRVCGVRKMCSSKSQGLNAVIAQVKTSHL